MKLKSTYFGDASLSFNPFRQRFPPDFLLDFFALMGCISLKEYIQSHGLSQMRGASKKDLDSDVQQLPVGRKFLRQCL